MKKKQTHITYGFVTALAMAIVGLILHVMGVSFEPWAQYVNYIPFLIGIILNAIAFSKANDADVTFGQVFSSGFKASAIITLVTLVWTFIFVAIFPEVMEKGMEMAQENMTKQGMSEEQIEMGMEMSRKYGKVFMVGGVVFGTMIVGLIFSLIGAAIAKKQPRNNSVPPATMS